MLLINVPSLKTYEVGDDNKKVASGGGVPVVCVVVGCSISEIGFSPKKFLRYVII